MMTDTSVVTGSTQITLRLQLHEQSFAFRVGFEGRGHRYLDSHAKDDKREGFGFKIDGLGRPCTKARGYAHCGDR